MITWLQGWWETFMIWAFDRETWNILTTPQDPNDFVEVYRPEGDS